MALPAELDSSVLQSDQVPSGVEVLPVLVAKVTVVNRGNVLFQVALPNEAAPAVSITAEVSVPDEG